MFLVLQRLLFRPRRTLRAPAWDWPRRYLFGVRDVNTRFTSSRGRGEYHSCGVIRGTASVWLIALVLEVGETRVHIAGPTAQRHHVFLSFKTPSLISVVDATALSLLYSGACPLWRHKGAATPLWRFCLLPRVLRAQYKNLLPELQRNQGDVKWDYRLSVSSAHVIPLCSRIEGIICSYSLAFHFCPRLLQQLCVRV